LVGRADAIVTANLRDFPRALFSAFSLELTHPDDFIVATIDLSEQRAITALRQHRAAFQTPMSAEEYVMRFERCGLQQGSARLRDIASLL
jgi:hypothetical protein